MKVICSAWVETLNLVLRQTVRLSDLMFSITGAEHLTFSEIEGAQLAESKMTLDPSALKALKEIEDSGQDNLLSQIIGMFFESTPAHLDQIGKSIQSKNGKDLAACAHSLKSSSGGLGAMQMARLCEELERLGKETQFNESRSQELFNELQKEFQMASQELRKYQTLQVV